MLERTPMPNLAGRIRLEIAFGVACGLLFGLGLLTFVYARGGSYFTDDSAAAVLHSRSDPREITIAVADAIPRRSSRLHAQAAGADADYRRLGARRRRPS